MLTLLANGIDKAEKLKSDFGKAALEFKFRLKIIKDAMKFVIKALITGHFISFTPENYQSLK